MKNNYLIFFGLIISMSCRGMVNARCVRDAWEEYLEKHAIATEAWDRSVTHIKQLRLTKEQIRTIENDDATDVHIAGLQSNYHLLDKILLEAASVGACKVAKEALGYGAKIDPEITTVKGESRIAMIDPISGDNPLLAAVRNGHSTIVQLLLDHGAYPNAPRGRCGAGETPLQIAVKCGDVEIVEILLQANASNEIYLHWSDLGVSALSIAQNKLKEAKKSRDDEMASNYANIIKALEQPIVKIMDGSTLHIPC